MPELSCTVGTYTGVVSGAEKLRKASFFNRYALTPRLEVKWPVEMSSRREKAMGGDRRPKIPVIRGVPWLRGVPTFNLYLGFERYLGFEGYNLRSVPWI